MNLLFVPQIESEIITRISKQMSNELKDILK